MWKVRIVKSDKDKQMFLDLPKRLYSKKYRVQDRKLEESLLNRTHVLSSEFEIVPLIMLNKERVVCRCMLTFYPEDEAAYLGFFECEDYVEYMKVLMNEVDKIATDVGKKKIIGPLDASFWIKYRFKTNKFNNTYTSEPYNLEYYPKLWQEAGFKVIYNYSSNQMRIPTAEDTSAKCRQRLENFKQKGYEFKEPTKDNFYTCMKEIYYLLTKLYSNFPGYKSITEEQFISMFKSLEMVLDFSMVKLVYKESKLAAFLITIPNYRNLTYNINLINIIKILSIKCKPKEYIMLYMGVDNEHAGLGSAIAELMKREMEKKKAKSISALILDGKVTNNYYKDVIVDKYTYALYERDILEID